MHLDAILIAESQEKAASIEAQQQAAATTETYLWHPEPRNKPQCLAYNHPADILLYGGVPGGGKTDLILGTSLTAHQRSIIFRKEAHEVQSLIDRCEAIIGSRAGLNGQLKRWRIPESSRQLEFAGVKNPGSEKKHRGNPHDFIGFDQVEAFTEHQFRYLITWLRSPDPNQRTRVIASANPPDDDTGRWLLDFWGPWLDKNHENPAEPGELRWYAVIDGEDTPVPDSREFVVVDGELVYDFDRDKYEESDICKPMSRSFIPASSDDNPYYGDEYKTILKNLPEPLRSMMLQGDFGAAFAEGDPWQVIPTEWVDAAIERWKHTAKPDCAMGAVGVDPARGGRDVMTIAPRFGKWFAPLIRTPGKNVDDGPKGAAFIVENRGVQATVNLDVVGIGSSIFDILKPIDNCPVIPINGAARTKPDTTDRSGTLYFHNDRARLYWGLREALDPDNGQDLCLPDDTTMRRDLITPKFKLVRSGKKAAVLVESKQDVIKRLKRSTDDGDAIVYAWNGGEVAKLTDAQIESNVATMAPSDTDDEPSPWE